MSTTKNHCYQYQYKEPCDHAYSSGKNKAGVQMGVKTLITIITISLMPHVTNGIHVWIKMTTPQHWQAVCGGGKELPHRICDIFPKS
jgi:hypothetical protein